MAKLFQSCLESVHGEAAGLIFNIEACHTYREGTENVLRTLEPIIIALTESAMAS